MDNNVTKNYVRAIIALASFLTPYMSSSINVALPAIGKNFEMDAVLLSWVASSYLISTAVFLVPLGRIADIHGRKKVFTIGIALITISSFFCAYSNSGFMLIAMRTLQGLGTAMTAGTGMAIITSVFPAGERGNALGINVAAVYLGLSIGPFIGGLLTQHFGWRSLFLTPVPLGVILITFTLFKLKEDWVALKGDKFDVIGSMIYGVMIITLIYGFSRLPDLIGLRIILIGILSLLVFVRWELRVKSPVLDLDLFKKNKVFLFYNLAALFHFSATFAVTFLLSLYLQYIKGFTPQYAGFILIFTPVIQAIFAPIVGRMSDKVAPRFLASGGMTITFVALSLLALLNKNTSLDYIIGVLALFGFGAVFFASPNITAIMSSVTARHYGVASATRSTVRQLGMTFSMGIVMLLFALYIGRVQLTPDYYDLFLTSMKMALIFSACLCFGGIFASLARSKVSSK